MAGKISLKINPDGSFEYIVKGVKGKRCKDFSKFLDKIGTSVESKNTNEYHEKEVETEKVRN